MLLRGSLGEDHALQCTGRQAYRGRARLATSHTATSAMAQCYSNTGITRSCDLVMPHPWYETYSMPAVCQPCLVLSGIYAACMIVGCKEQEAKGDSGVPALRRLRWGQL